MNDSTIKILLQQLKTQVTKSQSVKSWITLLVMTVNSKYSKVQRKPKTTHQYLHYTHSVDQLRWAGDLKSQRYVWSACQQHLCTNKSVQTSEQRSVCVCTCKLSKSLVYDVTFVFNNCRVLKYTICVIVYCDGVNVQPRFNFSDEIIK